MRPLVVQILCAVMLAAAATMGCQQTPVATPAAVQPAPTAMPADPTTGRQAAFSADRAWDDLRALTEVGPRVIDTPGNADARRYIEAELKKLSLEVVVDENNMFADQSRDTDTDTDTDTDGDPETEGSEAGDDAAPAVEEPAGPTMFVRNFSVTIPGSQMESGSILLIAPYDSQAFDEFEFVGANDGASGAAVLLELTRVIAADPLPYATEVVFLDSHAPFVVPDSDGSRKKGAGLISLALSKRDQDVSDVHLVLYLNRIGDADLHIARDLLSHRVYREEFWKAGQRLNRTEAFRPDATFESTELKYRPLKTIGLRRIVSLVDTAFGGDEPPGLYAHTEQDTMERCSPESLDAVGRVVLEGLEAISKWLIKIDRFSRLPLPPTSLGEPEGVQADEAETQE